MKNKLHNEIVKGLKKLGLSQQYNVLGIVNNLTGTIQLQNRFLAFPPIMKDQAMNEIRRALVLGPDKIDF